MNMKIITSCVLVFFMASSAVAGELEEVNLKKKIAPDSAIFFMAHSNRIGDFGYIVDRNTGLCFARSGNGDSLAAIDCDALKKIPEIKTYIETGKLP